MENKKIEYIDRERLKKAISADCQHLFSFDESFYDIVMNDIDEIPASDVAPLVHGKWVEEKYETISRTRNRKIINTKNWCSVCNKSNGKKKDNYCPNCGAIMDLK